MEKADKYNNLFKELNSLLNKNQSEKINTSINECIKKFSNALKEKSSIRNIKLSEEFTKIARDNPREIAIHLQTYLSRDIFVEKGLILSVLQKAAILMVSLPPEISAQILRELQNDEVQNIASEIAKLSNIGTDLREAIIQDFMELSYPLLNIIPSFTLFSNLSNYLVDEIILSFSSKQGELRVTLPDDWGINFKKAFSDYINWIKILSPDGKILRIDIPQKDYFIKFICGSYLISLVISDKNIFIMFFNIKKIQPDIDILLFSSEKHCNIYIKQEMVKTKIPVTNIPITKAINNELNNKKNIENEDVIKEKIDYIKGRTKVTEEEAEKALMENNEDEIDAVMSIKKAQRRRISSEKLSELDVNKLLEELLGGIKKENISEKENILYSSAPEHKLENLDIRKWLDNIPVREKIPAQETILKPVFRISIEFGLNLIPLVDPNKGAKLLERVNSIRRYISSELGLMVPGIGFRDNLQLKPDSYIIKINEFEIATGEVRLDRLLAIGPWNCLKLFTGPRCLEPTYGLPAVWIKIEERNEAERKGCMVFDSESVIGTHLTEIIRQHASELIGRQEIANMLATLKKSHPALEVYPELYNLGEIKIILQNLLKEQVSIRDIVTIMEILADYGTVTKNPDKLTEYVRHALRRDICREYQDGTGKIFVLTLNTKIEKIIERAVEKNKSFLEFKTGSNIIKVLDKHIKGIKDQGMQPILLCSPKIRLYIKRLTERFFPNLVVLAYNEIENGINVINVGCVSLPCYFTFLKVRVKKIIFYIEQYIKKQYLKWKYFKKTPLQKSVENDRYIRTEIVDKSLSNTCKHCGYKNNIQHGFIENYCAHCGKNLFNTEPTVDIEKINYLCLRLDVDKDVAIKSLMEYNNPRNALLNLKEKIKELQWASKKGDRRKDEIEYIAHKSCETDKIDEKNNLIKMTTSIESLGLDDKIKEIIKQTGISSYEAFLALTDVECCLDNALNLIKSNSDNQPVEEQKYKTIHELREVLYEPETWNKIEYITRETSCKISDAFKALIESSEDELSAVKAIQERKKEKKKEN